MVDLRLISTSLPYTHVEAPGRLDGPARSTGAEGLARCVTNDRGRAQVPDTTPGGATTALDALDSYQAATLWSRLCSLVGRLGLGYGPQSPDYASRRCPRVDARGSRYCARSFVAIVLGALCLAPGVGWARPGDPFGADDTGCAPATRDELHCESALTGALSRLVARMTRCKVQQADNAFRILHPRPGSTPPLRFDEEGCARSQAKAPFDQALSQLEGAGGCPAAALINARALGDTLVAGQSTPGSLDALDEAIYCDATSGTLIDPAGSASSGGSGLVPSTARHLRCSDAVGTSLALLARGLIRCHLRLARAAFHHQPIANQLDPGAHGAPYAAQLSGFVKSITVFSEEACERHAQARYKRNARRLAAGDLCPSCLDLTRQLALGDAAVAKAEQESGLIFICPGSTTSTTTTTTSTARPLTTTTRPATTTTSTSSPTSTTQPPTTTTQAPTTTTTSQVPTTSTTSSTSTTTSQPTTTTRPTTTTTNRKSAAYSTTATPTTTPN